MTRTPHQGQAELRKIFDDADAEGFLHVREIDGDAEVAFGADDPVVLASVFKVPVALAYARRVAAGELDPTRRITVTAEFKEGGLGTDGCLDDVEMTLRDLAFMMLTMSDNAATDVVMHEVGLDAVHAALASLGLGRTRVVGDCRAMLTSMVPELGLDPTGDIEAQVADVDQELLLGLSVRDPERTTSSTPREMTSLLTALWRDEAGPPEACAEVRRIMGQQIWPHRLSVGFEDGVKVSGKTGTLWGVRNEIGAVEYPDGRRYAAAVFLRPRSMGFRLPRADAAIGLAARAAVDLLRA
ncbi:serine hydrolase [Streptomyces sp. NPDC054961]